MPKVYVFLGLVGVYFFLVFFNIAGEFLVNFAGFLIPGYFSLEALFTTSKTDDTQVRASCCLCALPEASTNFLLQWLTVCQIYRTCSDGQFCLIFTDAI